MFESIKQFKFNALILFSDFTHNRIWRELIEYQGLLTCFANMQRLIECMDFDSAIIL